MPRFSALPQFHDTVTIPVIGRSNGLRVVVTADGILGSLVQFFDLPRNRDKSPSWQQKACRAVGLLYDYVLVTPRPTDVIGRRTYLSDFARSLMQGTTQADGSDPKNLFWYPTKSWKQVKEALSHVTAFADYCAKDGGETLNAVVDTSFTERVTAYRALDLQSSHSLLKHLGSSKFAYEAAGRAREVRARRSPKVVADTPPAFPRDKFAQLIEQGFRRRGQGDAPWERHHLRDIMIAILQRYGGLRASEPFHIFTRDVQEDPHKPGHALVRLYQPELGRFRYLDPLTRRVVETTRAEYLRDHCGRAPRNRAIGKDFAGWKDLMLDAGSPQYYALVRWFPGNAGAVFWRLYQAYVQHVLPPGLNHPYLFVSLDVGPTFGQPYRMAAYQRKLRLAVEHIGLQFQKELGTTSHGFRHAFGQDLADAKMDEKVIQVCMHHKARISQEIYTRPSKAKINSELEAARLRLASELEATLSIPDLLGRDVWERRR